MLNGKFMNSTDDYLNDQFVLRDSWISAQSVLEFISGKRESNGVFMCKNALIGKISGPNEDFINGNIAGINYFTSVTDMPASLIIVPSASEIQSYKLPLFAQVWDQKEKIDEIYGSVESAKCVSVYDTLSEHKNDYIFYRTDHHWTTYGAYLAYREYCSSLGLTPAEYSADTVSSSFNGTLYSSSGVRFIESDTMEAFRTGAAVCDIFDGTSTSSYDSVYFPEYLAAKDKYAYFLGTNQPIVTIYGENKNGPKLLLFKDSYAHCMAPMLLENYSQITLVDLRYINGRLEDYVDIGGFDQTLFLFGIDSFVNQNNIAKLTILMSGVSK
jgi:hypothetical protein